MNEGEEDDGSGSGSSSEGDLLPPGMTKVELDVIDFTKFVKMYYCACKSHGFMRGELQEIEKIFDNFHIKFQNEIEKQKQMVELTRQRIKRQRRALGADSHAPQGVAAVSGTFLNYSDIFSSCKLLMLFI